MINAGLIALDLDGTLLNDKKQIAPATLKALARCAERGIQVVPATGRPACGIPKELLELPGVNYAITTNGASIVDLKTGQTLKRCRISNETSLRVLELSGRYHTMSDPYLEGRAITQPDFFGRMEEFGLSPEVQALVRATRDVVPDVAEYLRETGKDTEKINIFLADLSERELLREELLRFPELAISSSMYNNLEINAKEATKGNGLLWLAEYLKIPAEDTVAFGDGENDISMLRAAGTGIAMGNAELSVKSAANRVTETNEADGVARAICELILGTESV